MKAGIYPGQEILFDASKKAKVVFRPVEGQRVSFSDRVEVRASFVELRDLEFGYRIHHGSNYSYGLTIGVPDGRGNSFACVRNVTIRNAKGHAFAIGNGVEHVQITGGTWGNYGWKPGEVSDRTRKWEDPALGFNPESNCPRSDSLAPRMRSIVISSITFGHNFQGCRAEGQSCAEPSHPDCLQIMGGVNGVTIRNNRFEACFGTYLFAAADTGGEDIDDVRIEGNWFGDSFPSGAFILKFNDKNRSGHTCDDLILRHNSFAYARAPVLFFCRPTHASRGAVVDRNIFARSNDCGSEYHVRWKSNLFPTADRCGRAEPIALGYRMVVGRLVHDPLLAPIVRRAFALALQGHKPGKIAKMLNGAPGRKSGARTWRAPGVVSLLRDKSYLGGRYGAPRSHPSLVDRQTWRSVQRALDD